MSIQHICDGCQKQITGEVVPAGNSLKRDYCKQCADLAQDFLNEENAIRVDLVDKFNKQRMKLIKKFTDKNKKFILPDVVYMHD